MEELLDSVNYLLLGEEEIQKIEDEKEHQKDGRSSTSSHAVSISSDDWISKNVASNMNVNFRIMKRVLERRLSDWGTSDKNAMQLASTLAVTIIDNMLGYNLRINTRLKRFYIGSIQLKDLTSGHAYSGSLTQFYQDFSDEDQFNMTYTALAEAWDRDKLKHFRYFISDHHDKRITVTAIAVQEENYDKVHAVLLEIYSKYSEFLCIFQHP